MKIRESAKHVGNLMDNILSDLLGFMVHRYNLNLGVYDYYDVLLSGENPEPLFFKK